MDNISKEELSELLALSKKGDEVSLDRLLSFYKVFILETIQKYQENYKSDLEKTDLFQEAYVGFLKVVKRSKNWDEFSSAVKDAVCLEVEEVIKHEVAFSEFLANLHSMFTSYWIGRSHLFKELGRKPSRRELSKFLGYPLDLVEKMEKMYEKSKYYEDRYNEESAG